MFPRRSPFVRQQQLIKLVPPRANLWKRLRLSLVAELGRFLLITFRTTFRDTLSSQGDRLDRLALYKKRAADLRNRLHNQHPNLGFHNHGSQCGPSAPSDWMRLPRKRGPYSTPKHMIVPRRGTVTVTSGNGFDLLGQPKQPKDVSEEVGIRRRDDVTTENVKKLIMRAIEEYRNDRDAPGERITTIT